MTPIAACQRIQFLARQSGARTHRERVQGPAREIGQRRRVGLLRDLAALLRFLDLMLQEAVGRAHAVGEERAHPVVDRGDGRGRADRVAAARAVIEIEVERLVVEALEEHAKRRIVGQRRTREGARFLAIVLERLEIEIALVAESGVKARPVHAGRLGQVVERGSGIARLPERIGGARERLRGIVGARPPAPFRLTRLFLYHFANNP